MIDFNGRIIEINGVRQIENELAKINCDSAGINIMINKALFKVIKLEAIAAKSANLLKQTFLAKGGEVAIAKGCADLSIEYSDVLICATLKQYRLALAQLKMQPWGLPKVATAIENLLASSKMFPQREYVWPNHKLEITPNRTLVMGILGKISSIFR